MWAERKKLVEKRKKSHNVKKKKKNNQSFGKQDLFCVVIWHLGVKNINGSHMLNLELQGREIEGVFA